MILSYRGVLSKAKYWKPLEVQPAILDPWGVELLQALAKADENDNDKDMTQE